MDRWRVQENAEYQIPERNGGVCTQSVKFCADLKNRSGTNFSEYSYTRVSLDECGDEHVRIQLMLRRPVIDSDGTCNVSG